MSTLLSSRVDDHFGSDHVELHESSSRSLLLAEARRGHRNATRGRSSHSSLAVAPTVTANVSGRKGHFARDALLVPLRIAVVAFKVERDPRAEGTRCRTRWVNRWQQAAKHDVDAAVVTLKRLWSTNPSLWVGAGGC